MHTRGRSHCGWHAWRRVMEGRQGDDGWRQGHAGVVLRWLLSRGRTPLACPSSTHIPQMNSRLYLCLQSCKHQALDQQTFGISPDTGGSIHRWCHACQRKLRSDTLWMTRHVRRRGTPAGHRSHGIWRREGSMAWDAVHGRRLLRDIPLPLQIHCTQIKIFQLCRSGSSGSASWQG